MARAIQRTDRTPLAVAGHPIYSALLPIPILAFVGALITDIAYSGSPQMMWLDFSSWLILAGLIGGGLAAIFLIVDLFRASWRPSLSRTVHAVLLAAAWVVEVFNAFVHARDGWTAVVPTGMTLSIVASLLSLLAGWFWQSAARGDVR